jgi:AraC-like DNA-binding protein
MEYVNELRLERAKKLLLAGGKSMTEIALDCGFGSSSYLSSSFHQAFKMTPSEYQRSVSKRQSRVKGQKRRGLIPGSRTL